MLPQVVASDCYAERCDCCDWQDQEMAAAKAQSWKQHFVGDVEDAAEEAMWGSGRPMMVATQAVMCALRGPSACIAP